MLPSKKLLQNIRQLCPLSTNMVYRDGVIFSELKFISQRSFFTSRGNAFWKKSSFPITWSEQVAWVKSVF